jgi:hypothetical protein
MATRRLTELDAVNRILSACGQKPANTVEGPTSAWTRNAKAVLDETNRQVQSSGWYFNTDPELTLSADAVTGEVPVPADIVRFLPLNEPWIVVRAGKLYDRKEGTFVLSQAKEGYCVRILDFEDLPEEAIAYITAKAARKTYSRYIGSQENAQNLFFEEREAHAALLDIHCEAGMFSMMDDPTLPFIQGSSYVPSSYRNDPRY